MQQQRAAIGIDHRRAGKAAPEVAHRLVVHTQRLAGTVARRALLTIDLHRLGQQAARRSSRCRRIGGVGGVGGVGEAHRSARLRSSSIQPGPEAGHRRTRIVAAVGLAALGTLAPAGEGGTSTSLASRTSTAAGGPVHHEGPRRQDEAADDLGIAQFQVGQHRQGLAQPGADGGNGTPHQAQLGLGLRQLGQQLLGCDQPLGLDVEVEPVLAGLGAHVGLAQRCQLAEHRRQLRAEHPAQAQVSGGLVQHRACHVGIGGQLAGQQVHPPAQDEG